MSHLLIVCEWESLELRHTAAAEHTAMGMQSLNLAELCALHLTVTARHHLNSRHDFTH